MHNSRYDTCGTSRKRERDGKYMQLHAVATTDTAKHLKTQLQLQLQQETTTHNSHSLYEQHTNLCYSKTQINHEMPKFLPLSHSFHMPCATFLMPLLLLRAPNNLDRCEAGAAMLLRCFDVVLGLVPIKHRRHLHTANMQHNYMHASNIYLVIDNTTHTYIYAYLFRASQLGNCGCSCGVQKSQQRAQIECY